MIHAEKALQLPNAQPSKGDIEDARNMLIKLREHIVKYMTLGGPTPLTVPFREMSMPASQLVCYAMKRFKWNVNATLMSQESQFAGGHPQPHHWIVQLQPAADVYDASLGETLTAISEAPILDS